MKSPVTSLLALAVFTLAALASSPVRGLAAGAQAAAPRVIEITATDAMKFSVTTIQAKRGEVLRLRLVATGTVPKVAMSHNIVVLKKGADAKAYADKAIYAQATAYVPAELKSQVIAASKLIGNGEKTEVDVKVPSVPGRYEYICTFPGHFGAGMKGVIVVK